jgi:hypothetical protein
MLKLYDSSYIPVKSARLKTGPVTFVFFVNNTELSLSKQQCMSTAPVAFFALRAEKPSFVLLDEHASSTA